MDRRYDLDWIRIISMAAVFLHHVAMYFNTWPWHAKNGELTRAFEPLNLVFLTWTITMFFLISGFAAEAAMGRRGAAGFLRERLLRLGVPLLVGAFLLSPHQVYSERVTYGRFAGTFLDFLPHYFDGWYYVTRDGNFAWMGLHLWYVLVLLVFTVVTLPVVLRTRAGRLPEALDRLFLRTGPAGVLLLPPVLMLALQGASTPCIWTPATAGGPSACTWRTTSSASTCWPRTGSAPPSAGRVGSRGPASPSPSLPWPSSRNPPRSVPPLSPGTSPGRATAGGGSPGSSTWATGT